MMPPPDGHPADERDAAVLQARLKAQGDALRFLSYRPRSEAEVRRKLERRYPAHIIEPVIAALKDWRYLDDASFAQEWRRQRERFRPRGELALRQELQRLGVDREIIDEALESFDAGENAYRAGSKLAQRLGGSDQHYFHQRLWGYLRRRGFEASVIGDTVQRLWRELAADPLDRHDNANNEED